ncbi:hypothetical protein HUG15_18460 [Salicibibacter cibarius]|uniref:Uncharacterized protein n=1 Tax=Salicibibacter cibarius TaxID=2743000 RepID=A0A7T6Z615_9BACI|nr:hypothetical protein HUG15_18460 [Salicibibacter cibarius]
MSELWNPKERGVADLGRHERVMKPESAERRRFRSPCPSHGARKHRTSQDPVAITENYTDK